ncbi:MAG: hypothetical protein JWP75_3395, partial [Frondihabitans sp.]|nr:hypothetical protein [Frondihabitans sp.]
MRVCRRPTHPVPDENGAIDPPVQSGRRCVGGPRPGAEQSRAEQS